MLLNQAISAQQSLYSQLQIQIEALQEQQRQIQAYLQRLGSVESKMESAAALLQEAISEIQTTCPDELPAYQELISGLFGSAPIAQLNASVAEQPTSAPAPSPELAPEPSNDDTVEVIAVVVTDETIEATATETIPPTETKEVVGESHVEPDFSKLSWKQLQKLAGANKLDPRGKKRPQIEDLLTQQGITQADIDSAA